jgi:hypothetical protein
LSWGQYFATIEDAVFGFEDFTHLNDYFIQDSMQKSLIGSIGLVLYKKLGG